MKNMFTELQLLNFHFALQKKKKSAGWNKQKSLQPLCEREQNPLKVEDKNIFQVMAYKHFWSGSSILYKAYHKLSCLIAGAM